ncbi:hypothetical protein FEE96_16505 [Parasedimentitalea maritima]|uniref:Uncharacterized protein n=1 Tax=Parasedimentitalea maritima TaxID=2578117 RepID=A0A5R8Z5R2_9RHOB|nr:hypothetical protein [Zongyanglinia marina]KAE9631534.1 hypothetical protein GP644_04230 [Zongyanglinia marina]TLP60457.1 hypothetical protein FEE96_16505 [Zongyanglinia marina]
MKKIILGAVFGIGLSGSALAGVQTYDCALNSWEEQGWVPSRVMFSVDPETLQARVYDGFIDEAEGRPISAKFKTIRGGKYRMRWKLDLLASSNRKIRINYSATYDPSTRSFNMRGNFPMENVTNSPSGDGHCQAVKGKSLF